MVATSPAGGATFTADCPNITNSSQVVITQSRNWAGGTANPTGTYSVVINPTGGTGGRGSFTITSSSASDIGQTVVYWVDGWNGAFFISIRVIECRSLPT
jgi:hypothetical protein